MSVDMSLASPTSPLSVDSTLSAWAALRLQLDARRITQVAAARRQVPARRPETAADLRARIATYNSWLDTHYVQDRGALADWVRARKAEAMTQLTALTAGGTK